MQEALVAAADNGAGPVDAQVAKHLAACPDCGAFSRDLAQAIRELEADLASLGEDQARAAVLGALQPDEAQADPEDAGAGRSESPRNRRNLARRLTRNLSRLALMLRQLGRAYLHLSAADLAEARGQPIARFDGDLSILPTRPVDRPGLARKRSARLVRDTLDGARALGHEEVREAAERSRGLLAEAEAYRLAAAEDYLLAALRLEPALVFAMNDLAILRTFAGAPAGALAVYDAAIELVEQGRARLDSGHDRASALGHLLANRGLALHLLGREQEALEHYDRALPQRRLPATLYNRFLSLLNLGRASDAGALLIDLDPKERAVVARMASGDEEMAAHRSFLQTHLPEALSQD